MIISTSKRFVFCAFNKTGTSSIEKALRRHGDRRKLREIERRYAALGEPVVFKHIRPLHVKRILGDGEWGALHSSCFVRNPFDRLVSLYHYHREKKSHVFPLAAECDFGDWVRRGGTGTVRKLMSEFVSDDDGSVIVDFVGRYEALTEDFAKLCAELGVNAKLPRVNATKRRGSYREFYADDTRRIVEGWVAADLEMFGYDF